MARQDDLLQTFLAHDILKEKYKISPNDIPNSVREALNSKIPIIKTIALIVYNLESANAITDNGLRNIVTQYLNEAAI